MGYSAFYSVKKGVSEGFTVQITANVKRCLLNAYAFITQVLLQLFVPHKKIRIEFKINTHQLKLLPFFSRVNPIIPFGKQ
jgi:hypothetical protein